MAGQATEGPSELGSGDLGLDSARTAADIIGSFHLGVPHFILGGTALEEEQPGAVRPGLGAGELACVDGDRGPPGVGVVEGEGEPVVPDRRYGTSP